MKPFSLNIQGRLVEVDHPLVMGILNATPDSFYAPSRSLTASGTEDDNALVSRLEAIVSTLVREGADIIDVGGYSTRLGAAEVPVEEELRRVRLGLEAVRRSGCTALVSVDTFRSEVARRAVEEWGAQMVNDVSGGTLDSEMFATVARLGVPYVLGHMRGTPQTMGSLTAYADVAADVVRELSEGLRQLSLLGVADVIVDPCFGFAKTPEQSVELLGQLEALQCLGCPVLVGVSRKSMLTATLGITAAGALAATTSANAFALDRGAAILRVHDVAAARQCVDLFRRVSQYAGTNTISTVVR